MRYLQLSKAFAKDFLSREDKKLIKRIDRIIEKGGWKEKEKGKKDEETRKR